MHILDIIFIPIFGFPSSLKDAIIYDKTLDDHDKWLFLIFEKICFEWVIIEKKTKKNLFL